MEHYITIKQSKSKKFFLKVVFYTLKGKPVKTIHFGDHNVKYYVFTHNTKAKKAYLKKHKDHHDWTKNGIYTRSFWERWILWNKKDIINSMFDVGLKYGLDIEFELGKKM